MRRYLNLVLPSALIFIAEALYFTGNPQACLAVHGLNVLVCIILPIVLGEEMLLFQSFSLVSLIRLVGLGMPLLFRLTLYNFVPVYAAAIIGAFIVIGEGRPLKEQARTAQGVLLKTIQSMKKNLALWTLFLFLGIGMGYLLSNIEFLIIQPTALVPEIDLYYMFALALIMIFFVGFGEELMFRAILQRRLQTKLGAFGGILLASAIFAAMHSVYFSVPYLIYVFVVGLFLGVAYHRTRSLGLVSLIHGSINFFLFSFLPYGYLRLF